MEGLGSGGEKGSQGRRQRFISLFVGFLARPELVIYWPIGTTKMEPRMTDGLLIGAYELP